jgi:YggT family protein
MAMTGNPFWDDWYFHIPNYLAAVVIYTLIGRFLLSFFLPPGSLNYIYRFFRLLTDWAVATARFITPGYVLGLFLPLIAAFWLFVIRHAYFVVLYQAGLAPSTGLQ